MMISDSLAILSWGGRHLQQVVLRPHGAARLPQIIDHRSIHRLTVTGRHKDVHGVRRVRRRHDDTVDPGDMSSEMAEYLDAARMNAQRPTARPDGAGRVEVVYKGKP